MAEHFTRQPSHPPAQTSHVSLSPNHHSTAHSNSLPSLPYRRGPVVLPPGLFTSKLEEAAQRADDFLAKTQQPLRRPAVRHPVLVREERPSTRPNHDAAANALTLRSRTAPLPSPTRKQMPTVDRSYAATTPSASLGPPLANTEAVRHQPVRLTHRSSSSAATVSPTFRRSSLHARQVVQNVFDVALRRWAPKMESMNVMFHVHKLLSHVYEDHHD